MQSQSPSRMLASTRCACQHRRILRTTYTSCTLLELSSRCTRPHACATLPSPPPPKPLHPPQPSPPPPGGPPPPPYAPLPPQPQQAVIVDGCGAVVSRCADKLEHAAIRCCGPSTLSCAASVCAPSSHRSPGDGLGLLGTDTDGHAATLEDAAFECMARGARLCDASELMAGACCGTGCGHNSRLVWSATSCVPPPPSPPLHLHRHHQHPRTWTLLRRESSQRRRQPSRSADHSQTRAIVSCLCWQEVLTVMVPHRLNSCEAILFHRGA